MRQAPSVVWPPTHHAMLPADALWLCDQGLRLGAVDLLPHCDSGLDKPDRLEALLAVAFRRRLPAHLLRHVVEAMDVSKRGDHVLANLRLAIAGLTRVPAAQDLPMRLSMAKMVLDSGLQPGELLEEIGLGGHAATKGFDPSQPRVPAGSGPASGRWTSGASIAFATSEAGVPALATAVLAAPLFAPELAAGAVAALSALAATVGFAATLGVLFVPSPNEMSSSGPLPDGSGSSYSYNRDEGLLRVLDVAGNVLAAGHKDRSGVFYDADTGVPFARELNGALLFDGGGDKTETGATPDTSARTDEDEEEDEPKLCPDPGPDQAGADSASTRAKAYQEQISAMINPQRPLPFGLAMNLINPINGKIIHYDECDERTGTMIDAKGPGYDGLLGFPQGEESLRKKFLRQGNSELAAAGSREVIWYFAEERAAAYARELFSRNRLGSIIIKVQPAVSP